MGMESQAIRIASQLLLAVTAINATGMHAAAQAHEAPTKPSHKPAHVRTAEDHNGAGTRATHVPQPRLTALFAWDFVMKGNARFVAARRERARLQSNKLARPVVTKSHHESHAGEHAHATTKPGRPAGAGKYVCCVVTCADGQEEIAPLLGLARKDVLELRVAGPFVTAEAVALIERTIEKHRLNLVLVLGHDHCAALAPRGKRGAKLPEDALERRLAPIRTEARSTRQTLQQALAKRQRTMMLATSRLMRDRIKTDQLRIIPGVIDEQTGAIEWLQRRIQELPVSPVK